MDPRRAPAFPAEKITEEVKEQLQDRAARVKEIFRVHCFECHGGSKRQAGVAILDSALLLKKRKVIPGKPEDSLLYQLVTATDNSVMPPSGQPRLNQDEIDTVRAWIDEGAAPLPSDVATPAENKKEPSFKGVSGVGYVLNKILTHVRTVPLQDRRFQRYFSINHILTAGTTANELDLQREALAKAINHLSWQERLVRPVAIDEPVNSLFAVDLRQLGWHQQPFERWQGKAKLGHSPVNLFDLALLDYPYGIVYEDSETFDNLLNEFLVPSGMVRPIAYVRADWFVSTITQPPFYEDFLQLAVRPQGAGREARRRCRGEPARQHRQARRHVGVGRVAQQPRGGAASAKVRRLLEELRFPHQQRAGQHLSRSDRSAARRRRDDLQSAQRPARLLPGQQQGSARRGGADRDRHRQVRRGQDRPQRPGVHALP